MNISLRHIGNVDFYIRESGALDAIFQRISGIGEPCWIHDQPIKSLVRAAVNVVDRLAFNICIENLEFEIPSFGKFQKRRVELVRSGTSINLWLSFAQIVEVRSLDKNDLFYFSRPPLSLGA